MDVGRCVYTNVRTCFMFLFLVLCFLVRWQKHARKDDTSFALRYLAVVREVVSWDPEFYAPRVFYVEDWAGFRSHFWHRNLFL
jgi:hypothetical protein